jgi:hypothetical protein
MVTTDELLHDAIVQTVCSTRILYYKLFVLHILYRTAPQPTTGRFSACHIVPSRDRHGGEHVSSAKDT